MKRSKRQLINNLKYAVRNQFAWPGGYALFGVMEDGGCLCRHCLKNEFKLILSSTRKEFRDGWRLNAIESCGEAELEGEETCDNCYCDIRN